MRRHCFELIDELPVVRIDERADFLERLPTFRITCLSDKQSSASSRRQCRSRIIMIYICRM